MEKNTMQQKPKPFTTTFSNVKELLTSILQGLMISAGTLLCYQYAVQRGFTEAHTLTMVFTALIAANIFLTLITRSFYYPIFNTMKYKDNLVLPIISITVLITALWRYVKPFSRFFKFEQLNLSQLLISIGIGFLSVTWY